MVSKYVARCRQGSDPGERFRRMEGQKEYEKEYEEAWRVASTADGIRPATKPEVALWLSKHPGDAQFLESYQVSGRTMKIAKSADGFIIE